MIPRASAWSSGKKLVPNISTFPCYKVHFRRRPTITPEIKEGGTVESISRRKLLRSGSQAIAGGACMGVLPMNAAASASASPATSVDYYQKLGVTPFFNAAEGGHISREDWIRVAHKHGVPCFNDAAADVPPISNLWNYTAMGFDLVAFSGGKGIRGPQCTGLLLGKKDLIDAAQLNNSPYSNTVGRGMKVGKEEIIGLVAAVDWFLEQDDAAMEAEFRKRAAVIAERVQNVLSVEAKIFIPPVANHVPHLLITYDLNRIKLTATEVMQKMREGTPRIELNPSTGGGPASAGLPGGSNVIVVGVWMLQPGEDDIVGRRLHEVLAQNTR